MPDPITRREFAGLVAAGTVISATSNECLAEDKAPPQPTEAVSPVELMVKLVQAAYPDERLQEAALEEVRTDFQHFAGRSSALSKFPLTNAHEPGFVFSAWRADRQPTDFK